jgi:hypothetical protein
VPVRQASRQRGRGGGERGARNEDVEDLNSGNSQPERRGAGSQAV